MIVDNKAYRQLGVWNDAMELTEMVHNITESFPEPEKSGLQPQPCQAAMAIPANTPLSLKQFFC